MKKIISKFAFAAVLISMAITSCKKEDTTVSSASQVSFGVTADNSISAIAANNNNGLTLASTAQAAGNASISWTAGTANIAQFKLEAKKNGKDIEIKSKNVSVDLFALTPALISAAIDTGTYKNVEIRVIFLKSSTADLPLVLKGTFTSIGGAKVPVEFDYNEDAVIKAEAESVTIDSRSFVNAKLNLHLNRMLSNTFAAEIDAATRTNGTILISKTSNTAIYNKIILNLLLAFEARGFERHSK